MSVIKTRLKKPDDPDGNLVKRIATGDAKAANLLVVKHLPSIIALAGYMLNDPSEAEDVAQEVFLKVWVHAKKWQPGKAKFYTWMHRVALNLCYDRLRKKREIYMEVLPEHTDESISGADEIIVNNQTSQQVKTAIEALAPRQKAAITLCHLQEMRNIEAAQIMQISVEALESLLARGRKALRLSLADQAQEMLEK
ncbi:MAG: RNA polymerase sigma factor [Robiginitomaculum sp.]|nr:RNA polymerase sigma factor [Robiginitomaculum sp.]